jgi:FkbM family methyltransferase
MTHVSLLKAAKSFVWTVCPASLSLWLEERYYLNFGELELSLVPLLCDPDRDAIDVGANRGCYTMVMRKCARHVVAFEPNPMLVSQLAGKFDSEVTVQPLALSRSHGQALLHIPVVGGEELSGLASLHETHGQTGAADHEVAVPTCPLDDAFAGDAGFIKIDVEGHEEAVLEGAQATMARCRPNVLIELEERHAPGTVGRAFRYFERYGYLGFFIRDNEVLPVEHFDSGTMQRRDDIERVDFRRTHGQVFHYTNNFLFFPAERAGLLVPRIAGALGHL